MSELVDEWLERHDHLQLNNVILNIVFKNLSQKDLMTCRLVCKTWNVLTIPFTRRNFEVRISGNNSMEDFMRIFRSNSLGIPYARFKLGSFSATEGSVGQEFLQVFGDLIKSIRCIREKEFTVEDLSQLFKSTPNLETFETPSVVGFRNQRTINLFPEGTKPKLQSLKKLTVSVCLYVRYQVYNACPTYLEEFITAAENISSLQLGDSMTLTRIPIRGEVDSPSLKALVIIEKLGRESSIQELKLSHRSRAYPEYFEILHKMIAKPNGLKLKSFEYYTRISNEECQGLLEIIPFFKDTLESLKISRALSDVFSQFPNLPRLRKLSLCVFREFNFRFVNLKELFPVLEDLELFQFDPLQPNEFFLESDPCPVVTSLGIHNFVFKFNDSQPILAIFPNLTKLTMDIEKDGIRILRQIWVEMTRLKYLSISGSLHSIVGTYGMDLDSYLIGSQAHALQGIGVDLNNMMEMSVLRRRDTVFSLRNQYCQFPSIVNLIDLKSLTLNLVVEYSKRPEGKKGLTDLTGYLGLYSMKRLKHLTIYNCEFTKGCCEMLSRDLGLESWAFKTFQDKEIIKSN